MSADLNNRFFPFDRLGLSRNPFCALSEDEWAALAWLHPAVQAALDHPAPMLALRGASGRGKSSALLAIKRELTARGREPHYLYLAPGTRRLKRGQDRGDPLLLDEIERLPARTRKRLYRRALAGGPQPQLVFSSHADLLPEANAIQAGALLALELPALTAEQLTRLLHDRIRSASTQGELSVWFEAGAVNLLLKRYDDDLRTIERALYEVFLGLDGPGAIDAERLGNLLDLSGANPAPG